MASKYSLEIQHNNFNIQSLKIEKGLKRLLKRKGIKQSEIKNINSYYIPESKILFFDVQFFDEEREMYADKVVIDELMQAN